MVHTSKMKPPIVNQKYMGSVAEDSAILPAIFDFEHNPTLPLTHVNLSKTQFL